MIPAVKFSAATSAPTVSERGTIQPHVRLQSDLDDPDQYYARARQIARESQGAVSDVDFPIGSDAAEQLGELTGLANGRFKSAVDVLKQIGDLAGGFVNSSDDKDDGQTLLRQLKNLGVPLPDLAAIMSKGKAYEELILNALVKAAKLSEGQK